MDKGRSPKKLVGREPPRSFDGDDGQFKRFVEAARALGCDEDESAFDEKLKKLATPRPKPPATSPPGEKPRDE